MYRMIIDTETTNGIEQPMPYDIGYAIFDDESGEIALERSFVVAEIYLDRELMSGAYYADKLPQYETDLATGKRELRSIRTIRRILSADLAAYGVRSIGAYNMSFDQRAVKNDIRFCTASFFRWFFPYDMEYFDVWTMACTSILRTEDYIFWAMENGLVSDKGNIMTSAEAAYRYITKDNRFCEYHTGLEDVRIEKEIFMAVRNSGFSYETKVSPACWQKVRKAKRVYYGV